MNKENVAKLITALRSGEYAQANGSLRKEDNYCCLGVACDISGLGQWEKKYVDWKYVIRDENGDEVASDYSTLPYPVAQWLGMASDGEFYLPNECIFDIQWDTKEEDYDSTPLQGLADINDNGFTFAQIADVLENANVFSWTAAPDSINDGDDDN